MPLLSVSFIMMSHLSDVQEELTMSRIPEIAERSRNRVNFVKYLVMKYKNTNETVDVDKVYEEFSKSHPSMVIK